MEHLLCVRCHIVGTEDLSVCEIVKAFALAEITFSCRRKTVKKEHGFGEW